MPAERRAFHHDIAGAPEVADEPLRNDVRDGVRREAGELGQLKILRHFCGSRQIGGRARRAKLCA
jgi:hypothetical protein